MKIFAVIPAYNEESKIYNVLEEVKKYVDKVVVVDDGSMDRTYQCACNSINVDVLRHIINRGQGAALKTGNEYALSQGADIILHFDSDGQFLAEEIPEMLKPVAAGEVEVILGSRFLSKKSNVPLTRKFVLKGGIFFNWFLTGLKLTDAHNGFRVLSKQAAEKINITQDRMAHSSEIVAEIARHELSYKELPVTVKYTDYSKGKGQSSLNAFKIVFDLFFKKLIRSK